MNFKILTLFITVTFTIGCGTNVNSTKISGNVEENIRNTNVITNVTNIESTVINIINQKLNKNVSANDISYETSNKSIANITEDGNLVPLKNGNVDVIIKSKSNGEILQKFNVYVEVYEPPTLIIELNRELSFDFYDREAVWVSSNPNIVQAFPGKIKGISKGEAEIKINDKTGNQELSEIKVIVQ